MLNWDPERLASFQATLEHEIVVHLTKPSADKHAVEQEAKRAVTEFLENLTAGKFKWSSGYGAALVRALWILKIDPTMIDPTGKPLEEYLLGR
jgi:hypothetical protein